MTVVINGTTGINTPGITGLTTPVSVSNGGTGQSSAFTQYGLTYANTTTSLATTTAGTSGQVLTSSATNAPTWTTATDANTASAIVQRDASGNFSAGTITATLSGNASTATNVAGLVANSYTTYGNTATTTTKNGYYGILLGNSTSHLNVMADASGNGGMYQESARWAFYYVAANASLGIMTSTTSASYALYVGGAIYATNNITAYSDRRAKKDIVTIDNALEKTNKLRGVYYKRIEEDVKDEAHHDKRQMGVIAQEVLEVAPEVVTYDKENDKYGVSYPNMVGLLIEAVKALTGKVEMLEAKLEQLTKDKS